MPVSCSILSLRLLLATTLRTKNWNSAYYIISCRPFSAQCTIYISRWRIKRVNSQHADLNWTRQYAQDVMIYGDIGDCGGCKYCKAWNIISLNSFCFAAAYVIVLSIAIIAPVRIFLVGTSIRFLEKQVNFCCDINFWMSFITDCDNLKSNENEATDNISVDKTSKENNISLNTTMTIFQTACVSVFYIYPILVNSMLYHFQIAFLPDFLLVVVRLAFMARFLIQLPVQTYSLFSLCTCSTLPRNSTSWFVLTTLFREWVHSN